MIGKKEKKRWTTVAEFFNDLEVEPELWDLSPKSLRDFVSLNEESEDEDSSAEPQLDEPPVEVLVDEAKESSNEELIEESVSSTAEEFCEVSQLEEYSVPALDLSLPATSFFSQVDWSGSGEAASVSSPVPVGKVSKFTPRPVSLSESASSYFSLLPWDGESVFEPSRLHSPRGLGRLMETATQQALRTAQVRGGGPAASFSGRVSAREYFSEIRWQQAAN